jgi:glycerol uptake facilitator-like aquaporin
MAVKNQRGQVMTEFVLTFLLFISLLTAITTMSKRQREISNQYKISKSIKD